MNLLDVAARSETIEDNILLDKEDDEEISQGLLLRFYKLYKELFFNYSLFFLFVFVVFFKTLF